MLTYEAVQSVAHVMNEAEASVSLRLGMGHVYIEGIDGHPRWEDPDADS